MRDKFTVSPAAERFHNARDIQSGNIGDKYDITFFVSCYNEEEFIVATLDTVQSAMEGFGLTYDIVIIDDGSKDGSPELVRQYIADHPDMSIVFRQNARNKGWAQNYIDSVFIGKGRYHRAFRRQRHPGAVDGRIAEAGVLMRRSGPRSAFRACSAQNGSGRL